MDYLGVVRGRRYIILLAIVLLLPVFWLVGKTSPVAMKELSEELIPGALAPSLKTEQRIGNKKVLSDGLQKLKSVTPEGMAVEDSISFPALPAIGDRIIKTATLSIKVKEAFSKTYDKTTGLANNYGGQVVASNLSSEDGSYTGTITIKVPTESFEKLISDLKDLGIVTSIDVVSQDVSEEYVDLESRVKHLRAQEGVMLALMEKAVSISDSIAVQSQLSGIQQQIEQATGRLNFLKSRTDLSTIQIMINDPAPISITDVDEWGFGAALLNSAHAAINTINGFIIFMGYLLPLALIGSIIYVIINLAKRGQAKKASAVA